MKLQQFASKTVVSITGSMTVQQAAATMQKNGVGSLVVKAGATLLGVLTNTDIVHFVAESEDLSTPVEKLVAGRPVITALGDMVVCPGAGCAPSEPY